MCDQHFGANGRQESSIPEDLNQVKKINIFKFAKNMSPQPRPLRQRSVVGIEEIVQTLSVARVTNNDILNICVVFHPDQIISGEFNCAGMDSCFLCRFWKSLDSTSLVEEILCKNLQSFAHGLGCHNVDYSYEIWYGLSSVRAQIYRLMCKSTLVVKVCHFALKKVPRFM